MTAQTYSGAGTAARMQFKFLAQPTDVNWGGVTHGGTVMRWIDETAHTCVIGWIKQPAVAVYAGGIHFERAIRIGDIVEVEARIIHTSSRSIHVAARVSSADPVRRPLPTNDPMHERVRLTRTRRSSQPGEADRTAL